MIQLRWRRALRYTRGVKAALGFIMIGALSTGGCRATHDVLTTPARLFHHEKRQPNIASSDVTAPGYPVAPSPSPSPSRRLVDRTGAGSPHDNSAGRSAPQATPNPSASVKPQTVQFPTAKPVPDKPGWVYSPSDPSKYVDVTGYASGSKVKDPYSGKIFTVP
jgi:hypothetical protein